MWVKHRAAPAAPSDPRPEPDVDDATVRPVSDIATVGIGAFAGVVIAVAGARPTGSAWFDTLLLAASLALVAWAGERAPGWVIVAVAAVAAAAAAPPIGSIAGIVVVLAAIVRLRPAAPGEQALFVGAAFLVVATAGSRGPFGLTAAIGITLASVLLVAGSVCDPRVRVVVGRAVATAAFVVLVAVAGLAAAAVAAGPDLQAGNDSARSALTALRDGDLDTARPEFASAAASFQRAEDDLAAPWAQLARFVPVAAQHLRAATTLTSEAAVAAGTVSDQLALVDLDSLSIVGGRIDIDAIVAVRGPMARTQDALDQLGVAVRASRNPWLIEAVGTRIDRLADELETQREVGEVALAALDVAPDLLGRSAERSYFVMFTTPGEARGQGGFMANHALVTVDDGAISVSDVARADDLDTGGVRPRTISGPIDWLNRYGPYGFRSGPDGTVGEEPWSNITISPHFPSTAQVVAELYPQSGGSTIDGVISLDVFALERIVGVLGGLDIPGHEGTLDGTNLAEFLLVDQYENAQSERVDLLEAIAAVTVDELLRGNGADTIELGRELAPMVRERRLMAWSRHPAEQDVLTDAGAAGELFPDIDPADDIAFSLRVVNGGASKIDTFLERSVCIDPGEHDGDRESASVRVELTNLAPASGLPDYVIGNVVGLPTGSSRLLVSWHSTVAVDSISIDGSPAPLSSQREQGAWAYTFRVDIASMDTVEIVLTLDEPIDPDVPVHASPQPLVRPERWRLIAPGGGCGTPPSDVVAEPGVLNRS